MGGVVRAVGNLFGGGGGGGGGGGSAPPPAAQTVTQTSIPEYARPYVERMLGKSEALTDITQNPYQAYEGERIAGFSPMQQQAFANVAGQTPASQLGTATDLATASGLGALGIQPRAEMLGQQALGYGAAGSEYGALGAQTALARAQQAARQAQMYGGLGAQFGGQAAGLAPQAQMYGARAADIGMGGLGYGAMGAGFGAQAAGLSPTAQMFGQEAANIGAAGGAGAQSLANMIARQASGYGSQLARSGQLGLRAGEEMGAIGAQGLGLGALGTGYGARGAQAAEQGFGAGEQYARMATSPEAMGAYMSPYMQQAVDRQKFEATRDYEKQLQAQKAQAVGAGAFGGSRQAIAQAEAQRNLNEQLQNIQAAGTQRAFEQAQQAQQFGAGLGVQGLQAGYGGLGLGMQGAGVGLSGLGAALQGQQGRLAGLGAYQQGLQAAQSGLGQAIGAGQLGLAGTGQSLAGQQARLAALGQAGQFLGQGMQGAQVGIAGLSPALQGQQAGLAGLGQAGQLFGLGMQGAGLGLQGVGQQLGAGQLGLAGTGQGIAGAQAGMQGVQGALGAGQYGLAGLGQAAAAAGTLGQLGQTQFAQEQAINQAQQQVGAVQQAQAQQALDLAYQDFLKQRNYPYQQLAFQSDMLRGLPLSQSAQTMYAAPPSLGSQLGGLGMAGLGLYGMSGGFRAKGGVIKEKKMAAGGYARGGDIKMMTTEQLEQMLENPSLNPLEIAEIEKQLMLRRRIEMNPESEGIMQRAGITAIPTGNMVPMEETMAGGGIVAFAKGDSVKDTSAAYEKMLMEDIQRRQKAMESSDPYAKSEAREARIEEEIKKGRETAPYRAMAAAGFGTMAGTSQYGLSNAALGGLEGLKSYSQAQREESDLNKLLLQQAGERERSKFARETALLGSQQTALGQLLGRRSAAETAAAARGDTATRNKQLDLTRAQNAYTSLYNNAFDELTKSAKPGGVNYQKYKKDPDALKADARRIALGELSPELRDVLGFQMPAAPATPTPPPAQVRTPPAAAVAQLRNNDNPQTRAQFDAIFGAGAAQRALGK